MFRFTMKPSSGSHGRYLAKITHSLQCEYMEVVQKLSVLWLHSTNCEACVPGVAQCLRRCATSRPVPGSKPGGVGHREFSRGYRQNHVLWGQLSL